MQFQPSFITCTYGAGGSTREKTMNIVDGVKRRFNIPVASHLTCVNASIDELRAFLEDAGRRQIDYIVALRGDPPQGETEFKSTAGGLQYANQLVELIHAEFSHFGVAVAGYPETHQEAVSADADLENLKRKVDAGADIVITQLFYNNEDFFRFRDRVQKVGISVPLVPGILPVTNLAQIQRITAMCGAQLPAGFVTALGQSEDSDSQFRVGVDFATQQIQDLMDRGVPGVHFYVLNKSQATSEILTALNLERQP
jgi:methylenetetrahydrofolate reductase (NADPH)